MKTELLQEHIEMVEQLKTIPALQLFGMQDVQRIQNFSQLRRYEPEETIITQGSFDTWVFFLVSGELRVVRDGETIHILRRTGDIFGEMCIIDGAPRSASIVAKTEALCFATDVSYVDTLHADDKAAFCAVFYRVVAEVLARRLRETSAELAQAKKEIDALKK
jgi:CRP/FNR family cyclic AMP-dependent transcriptional regulator